MGCLIHFYKRSVAGRMGGVVLGEETYLLKWNEFNQNLGISMGEMRTFNDFFDVTLACDNAQILAHKVVLGACSPFFRRVLKRNPHTHPLLYLKGIRAVDLESLVNFMYDGEVSVVQTDLETFLGAAEELEIKGLTRQSPEQETYFPAQIKQMGEIGTKRPHHVTTVAAAAEPTLSPQQAPPPAKRQKCGNSGVKLKPLIQTKF